MILFVLTGQAPPILVLTLTVMAYLTGYDLWKEGDDVPPGKVRAVGDPPPRPLDT